MKTIGVIGAGAWGTALAQAFASADRETLIWARESEVVTAINNQNENTIFLPSVPLSANLKATESLDEISAQNILLLVSPAQYLRATLESIKDKITADTILVICSKGIEISTGMLMSDVAKEITPNNPIAVLTGPPLRLKSPAAYPAP
jgi:glycerol-3-phosphate dehydrogenase (NAD(P)+)